MERAYKTKESVEKRVIAIVAEKLGVLENEFTLQSSFTQDLSVDSLDMAEVIKTLEKEFAITLSEIDTYKMTTVALAVDIIWEKCEREYHFVQPSNINAH
jgi:acyl carrier protein